MTKRLLAVTLAIATSGCSIAFMDKPSTGVATSVKCTDSNALWLVDGAITALAVMATGYGVYKSVATHEGKEGNVIGGVAGITGIVFTASMGNGIRWSHECSRQKAGVAVTANR